MTLLHLRYFFTETNPENVLHTFDTITSTWSEILMEYIMTNSHNTLERYCNCDFDVKTKEYFKSQITNVLLHRLPQIKQILQILDHTQDFTNYRDKIVNASHGQVAFNPLSNNEVEPNLFTNDSINYSFADILAQHRGLMTEIETWLKRLDKELQQYTINYVI